MRRFREAVTWQNRSAVEDGLDSLLRKPEGATDSKTRKKELLVVRYLQAGRSSRRAENSHHSDRQAFALG